MKRQIAWVVYAFGALAAVRAVVAAATDDSIFGAVGELMFGLALWWFAAGIGIRLGLEPFEFVDGIRNALGLDRPTEDEFESDELTF